MFKRENETVDHPLLFMMTLVLIALIIAFALAVVSYFLFIPIVIFGVGGLVLNRIIPSLVERFRIADADLAAKGAIIAGLVIYFAFWAGSYVFDRYQISQVSHNYAGEPYTQAQIEEYAQIVEELRTAYYGIGGPLGYMFERTLTAMPILWLWQPLCILVWGIELFVLIFWPRASAMQAARWAQWEN